MKKGKSQDCCTICKKPKNAKDFYRASQNENRLRNICIECWAKERMRPEKIKLRKKWLYSVHGRFLNARKEAISNQHKWSLAEKDYALLAILPCHYCRRIFFTIGSGLDRIDNTRGYESGNVLPCCGECNRLRSNVYTVEETEIMVQTIIKYRAESNIRKDILAGMYYL